MRFLTVGNSFPPQDLGGGYEAVWEGAVRHLESAGHTVRVLTVDHIPEPGRPEFADAHRELRWYWRDHGFPARSRRECLAIERHNISVLKRHLADFEPDVVSWWSMGGITLALLEVVRRRGLPAVAFVHDDWLDYGRRADAWHRRARRPRYPKLALELLGSPGRIHFDRVAHYAFVSSTTRDHAIKRGLELSDTSVVHSGISDRFRPQPERDWSGALLYVGRIDPRKGVSVAISALAHVPNATLEIVGDGPPQHVAELRKLASSLKVADRVQFSGAVDAEALPTTYASADAVIFPVLWSEPWGLVPLEAMACARPVIATGRGGSGEYLLDGVNCLLYPGDDPVQLGERIQRLGEDPRLRAKLTAAGFSTAAAHTAERFNRGVEAALTRVAGD